MSERKLVWLSLDLQFFAEDNEADNSSANESVKEETETPVKAETEVKVKTFTQEEVNKIDAQTKAKTRDSIYKKLGVTSDEELMSLIEKVKGYDANLQELNELKAEKVKSGYLKEISSQNVSEEYVDVVYAKVQPNQNEKIEDYRKRVEEFVKEHQALCKPTQQVPTRVVNTNFNYNGKQPTVDANDLVGALNEKFKR